MGATPGSNPGQVYPISGARSQYAFPGQWPDFATGSEPPFRGEFGAVRPYRRAGEVRTLSGSISGPACLGAQRAATCFCLMMPALGQETTFDIEGQHEGVAAGP